MSDDRRAHPTPAELRQALHLDPEWDVLWTGANPLEAHDHLWGGLYGPGGTYVSEYVTLTFAAIGRPGIEAAWCPRCWGAWVRAYLATAGEALEAARKALAPHPGR